VRAENNLRIAISDLQFSLNPHHCLIENRKSKI